MAATKMSSEEYQARLAGARAAFNTMSNQFSNAPTAKNQSLLSSMSNEFQAYHNAASNSDKTEYSVNLTAS